MNLTFAVVIVCSFVILVGGQDGEEVVAGATNKATNSGLTSTIVQQSHERVLMRRKRFLIFPKGANIIVSICRYPTGPSDLIRILPVD